MTHYRVLEMMPSASLLEIDLETGRTHQIRVHAYRALARLGGTGHPEARDAILETAADHGFRGRAGERVDIAACRALGGLLGDTDDGRMAAVAAFLIERAGHPHPHVASTALGAMARAVADRPLPDEAADRESLLPVWRIRMARAAAGRLGCATKGAQSAVARGA